jgi:hypothetical protein
MADLPTSESLPVVLETTPAEAASTSAEAAVDLPQHPAIERLLAHTEDTVSLPIGLHVGAVVSVTNRIATVLVEGAREPAALAEHVDADFLDQALKDGQPVLLQNRRNGGLIVLGVVQGKYPSKVAGERVEITGHSEVVVRSGKSALRLREDGVVDLIGARISASSRGLLRLVGRALRLN